MDDDVATTTNLDNPAFPPLTSDPAAVYLPESETCLVHSLEAVDAVDPDAVMMAECSTVVSHMSVDMIGPVTAFNDTPHSPMLPTIVLQEPSTNAVASVTTTTVVISSPPQVVTAAPSAVSLGRRGERTDSEAVDSIAYRITVDPVTEEVYVDGRPLQELVSGYRLTKRRVKDGGPVGFGTARVSRSPIDGSCG